MRDIEINRWTYIRGGIDLNSQAHSYCGEFVNSVLWVPREHNNTSEESDPKPHIFCWQSSKNAGTVSFSLPDRSTRL